MALRLERSIVRIRKEDRSIVGSGFLTNSNTILTCAHVISAALNIQDNPKMPESGIYLDFPLLDSGENCKIFSAHVVSWSPENEDDIASLELDEQLPQGTQSIILKNVNEVDLWGHKFRAFGFPATFDIGVWASGVLRAKTANGWIHIEDIKDQGHRVEPGFSGSPVWDDELKSVVGMVVAAEKKPGKKVAFIMPTKILIKYCPEQDNSKQIPLGKLMNVPDLPQNFLPRPKYLDPIKESILSKANQKIGITSLQRVGLWGMGGIGKSVVAAAIARDKDVRKTFIDGVIWLAFGQEPNLASKQQEFARAFGGEQLSITNIQDGKIYIKELLANKSCLIILDDIWEVNHIDPFDVIGENSKILLTTRKYEVIQSVDAKEHKLDLLSDNDALILLANRSSQALETLPADAKEVAKECGNLPLALAMVGSMAKGKPGIWGSILFKLKNADLEKIRRLFKGYEHDTLLRAIEVSVEDLEPVKRDLYLDLAVFPEDTSIPLAVLQTFWEPKGLNEYDALDIIYDLADRSMAQVDEEKRLRLHDLQLDYVRAKVGDLKELNNKLLEVYKKKCKDDWYSGPNDGYFFEHLAYHLFNANRIEELKKLLFDPKWLRAKLEIINVNALITDYDLLDDPELQLIQGAIRLSANAIENDTSQLAGQLIGRLIDSQSIEIQSMLEKSRQLNSHPWLCPITASLMPPGGQLFRILDGHTGWVSAVAVTPDGNRIVSGSLDKTIKVWDLETGKILKTLDGHTDEVNAVAVTPDGDRIVSGSSDRTIKIWDLETGKILKTLEGHTGKVSAVVVTSDGNRIVSGSMDKTIKVWDLEAGKILKTLDGHTNGISAVAVTPDGDRIVSGSMDKTIKVWDLETGKILKILIGHFNQVLAIAVTPDGNRVVSGSMDKTIKVWDLETGKILKTLDGHTARVESVAVTPNGYLLSGSMDNTFKIWDLKTGQILKNIRGPTVGVHAIAVTPDGDRIVSGSIDTAVKVWNFESSQVLRTIDSHVNIIADIAVTLDGRRAISGSADNTLKVWDLKNGLVLKTLEGHTARVATVAVTPDGSRAISGSFDRTVKVWDLRSGKALKTLKGNAYQISSIAMTLNGHKAVLGSLDCRLKVWDLENGYIMKILKGHTGVITAIAITPDGNWVISGSSDNTLKVWNLKSGKALKTLKGHTMSILSVAVTPNGSQIISGSMDTTIKVWDLKSGKILKTLDGHTNAISAVTVTPDGDRIVSGSWDNTVKIWDLENGSIMASFSGDGPITACTIGLNGEIIVSGESSGSMHFLRLETA